MPITSQNLNWIAGIVEGEGCFTWGHGPVLSVEMTDEDVIQKLNQFWKVNIWTMKPEKPHHKISYKIALHGYRAISWAMTLYSLMGYRRKSRILEILQRWKESPKGARVSDVIRQKRYQERKRNLCTT